MALGKARPTAPGGTFKRAGLAAARRVVQHFASVFRQLGLQITGVLFLSFAASFGYEAWHSFKRLPLHSTSHLPHLQLGIALLFLYFGLSSFARANGARQALNKPH